MANNFSRRPQGCRLITRLGQAQSPPRTLSTNPVTIFVQLTSRTAKKVPSSFSATGGVVAAPHLVREAKDCVAALAIVSLCNAHISTLPRIAIIVYWTTIVGIGGTRNIKKQNWTWTQKAMLPITFLKI